MEDPVTLRQDVVEKAMSGGDMVLITKYEKPAEVWGEDQFKDYDLWVANRIQTLLMATFPGYPWCSQCDSIQGIAKLNIPILMGVAHFYAIRLNELTPGKVVASGGEILERYGLPRDRFILSAFLDARAKHSKLVHSFRPIPT